MWWCTPLETVDIVLHGVLIDTSFIHGFDEHVRVVDTLTTGQNLFSTNEDIERV